MSAPPAIPLVLDRDVRRHGDTLTGGSPRRAVRLTDAGWRALGELAHGNCASAAARALGRRLLDAGIAHPRPPRRDRVSGVTVVIPVRDRPQELDRCLAAIGPATGAVVIDDGSTQAAEIAAVADRHGARLIRRPPPGGGPAAARNAALPGVQTELVAFLDSDCVPDPGWLQTLVGHFDDPEVGAVAPRVRPLGGPRPGTAARYLAARSPLDMGRREARVQPGGTVPYVPTAALLVRRRALAHGFDGGLRYGEDVDFVWRLRGAGWQVRYDPAASVGHHEPRTVRAMLVRRFRYGTSAAPLAARHPGRLAPAVFAPGPALVLALALARRPGAAALVAAGQAGALRRRVAPLSLPRSWPARWYAEAGCHTILSTTRYLGMFGLPLAPAYARWGRRRWRLLGLLVPAIEERRRRRPELRLVRWTALWLADDAAYGLGVMWGCLRARTIRPLLPRLATNH